MNQNNPAGNYIFKVNNKNTRTRREICSKLTIKTQERRRGCCSGVFIDNFEHISHHISHLVFLNAGWERGIFSPIFEVTVLQESIILDCKQLTLAGRVIYLCNCMLYLEVFF